MTEDGVTPVPDAAFVLLFDLIINTGLRLSEALKLRVDQYDGQRGLLKVEGSKGERGRIKPRTVPLVPALRPVLADWCKGRVGLVFPFWSGDPEELKRASARISHRYKVLFDYAQVPDCTEHDMRHEATCRWVTMRDKAGRWMWSETEICKFMGWTDTKMFLRYASLRGEDFADRRHPALAKLGAWDAPRAGVFLHGAGAAFEQLRHFFGGQDGRHHAVGPFRKIFEKSPATACPRCISSLATVALSVWWCVAWRSRPR